MTIAIIDYGLGNLGSIVNMFQKIGAAAFVSADPEIISGADKLIIPGVGAFDTGMSNLEKKGLIQVLSQMVIDRGVPVLGVCLGMQLMALSSEEGRSAGLGWINARFIKFRFPEGIPFKVPHMGWNTVAVKKINPLISLEGRDQRYYFVHTYHAVCNNPADVLATAHHGYEFVAAFSHENIYGVQFHPEKSHKFGMHFLKNFLERV